jgi:hypothetical protein
MQYGTTAGNRRCIRPIPDLGTQQCNQAYTYAEHDTRARARRKPEMVVETAKTSHINLVMDGLFGRNDNLDE